MAHSSFAPDAVAQHIVAWLQDYLAKSGMDGWVVGVSGGIDSAVTSTLCAMTGAPTACVEMPIHQAPNQVSRASEHIEALCARFPRVRRSTHTPLLPPGRYVHLPHYHLDDPACS